MVLTQYTGFSRFYEAMLNYKHTNLGCLNKAALTQKLTAIISDGTFDDALWLHYDVEGWHSSWVGGASKKHRFAVTSEWRATANVGADSVYLEVRVTEDIAEVFLTLSRSNHSYQPHIIASAIQLFALFDALSDCDNFSSED